MPARHRHGALALALASLLLGGACERLLGVDFDSAELAPKNLDGGQGEAAVCDSFEPPGPPSTTGAGDEISFTVVIHNVDFGDRKDAQDEPLFPERGYDIDGTCTGISPAPCQPPSWTGLEHVDGPRGQDNGVGRILLVQGDVVGTQVVSSSVLNENMATGAFAPFGLIRVKGYGGFTDDEHVVVDWFVALAPKPDATSGFTPLFDGSDAFPVDAADELTADGGVSDAASAERISIFRDENAYVSRRILVAHFPRVLAPLANVYFEVVDAQLTGTPVRDTQTGFWTLAEGIFSGRAKLVTLLEVVPETAYVTSGIGLCPGDPNFGLVKQMICSGADTLFEGTPGPGAECDGVSVGMSFESAPAVVGPAVDVPPKPPLCAVSPDARACSIPPSAD
jgi:hypothetical protein